MNPTLQHVIPKIENVVYPVISLKGISIFSEPLIDESYMNSTPSSILERKVVAASVDKSLLERRDKRKMVVVGGGRTPERDLF